MSDPENNPEVDRKKRNKMAAILGLLLTLLGGGGGFYAAWSGMVFSSESTAAPEVKHTSKINDDVYFVSVEPLVISLGTTTNAKHLRFRASLEVPIAYKDEVQKILPRVVDVFNSYLRALDPGDFEERAALTKLRAQMLRRVQAVAGQDRVTDLLVMEFVLN